MTISQLLGIAAASSAIVALLLLYAFARAARRRRFVPSAITGLAFLVAALLSVLSLTLLLGIRGYRALTQEEIAAYIWTVPDTGQSFVAHARLPGRPVATFRVAGDELYVDAHILKWKSLANLLGLHTQYELDRIGGRYSDIEDEKTKQRTVYSLGDPKLFDLFDLRRSSSLLAPVVDAEYGSATFIAAPDSVAAWEVRVSTSGLLIRQVEMRNGLPDLD